MVDNAVLEAAGSNPVEVQVLSQAHREVLTSLFYLKNTPGWK